MANPVRPKEMTLTFRLEEKDETAPPAKPSTSSPEREKYTTILPASLIKRLKLLAIHQDLKDRELVERAVLEYLERNGG